MTAQDSENDILNRLLKELRKDGTHPDFPERKVFQPENWQRIPWSELAFDLPALAIYGRSEENDKPVVGVVIALGHWIGGTRILVRSIHNGETVCHLIDESPSGLKPCYLLVKRHLPMADIP
jgi:hypothetical protein